MKFKNIIAWLLAASCLLLLAACNETPPIETTTGETTSAETTTAESTSLLTETYVFPPASQTNSPKVDLWIAPGFDEWLFTPEYEMESSEKYDFSFIIMNAEKKREIPSFWSMPYEITCHIVNKTGEPFWQVGTAYLEYKGVTVSGVEGWIRVPYANVAENKQGKLEYANGEGDYMIDLQNRDHLGDGLSPSTTYESGDYRIVFYLNDGPHYVYFYVTATPV